IDGIHDSIRRAAEHLPRIDAIGVSSAGIYVNNRTMVASLFRNVSDAEFNARIKSIYLDVAEQWGAVPLQVANDGDVTALAGELDAAAPSEKLKRVQELLAQGDPRPRAIFETLGVYLGYGLLQYSDFYPLKHVLLLGRVTSGQGGSILLDKAREVLALEAPEL